MEEGGAAPPPPDDFWSYDMSVHAQNIIYEMLHIKDTYHKGKNLPENVSFMHCQNRP